MSSEELFLTRKRLTAWGNWCERIVTQGLGYSGESIISRMQRGAVGSQAVGQVKLLIPTNEQAEEVDELLEQLAGRMPEGRGRADWAKVLRIHYTMRSKDIKEKAQIADLNKRTYYRHLQDGQEWLSQYLTFH